MTFSCTCVQPMPKQLYDGCQFFAAYQKTLQHSIPGRRFLEISSFVFKMRDFLIGASQSDHGVVMLQNQGDRWVLLHGENNSPYHLLHDDFDLYVKPALRHIREEYTCGWNQSDERVFMVVKRFFFRGV